MNKRILLADDDPDIIEVVSMLLEDEGYEIITAADGAEALERIENEHPDLVILDLLMPRVDGFAVINTLREPRYEQFSATPVIVLTSVREEVSKRRYELETGKRMEYAAYLEKPADPDELLDTVSALLSSGSPP
ncbi:MAG: response regulator [Actinobacteria bacterium]|nr:response regulator [Actinomycetota bacterium]